tara:strand:+ start:25361 stop:26086 length:726 start_codon:yes stop_codon:yes gene_type:complete
MAVFELVPTDSLPKHKEQIERVRKDTLPSNRKLEKIQNQMRANEISEFTEDQLVIETQGESDRFWLEFEQTGTRVGRVGLNRNAGYRLLWLADGRTFELFTDYRTNKSQFFANANSVGAIQPVETARFLWFFQVPIAWEVTVASERVLKASEDKETPHRMLLSVYEREPVAIESGQSKPPTFREDVRQIGKRVQIMGAHSENDRWFVPRSVDLPLCQSSEELLALVAFSLMFREAYWDLDS